MAITKRILTVSEKIPCPMIVKIDCMTVIDHFSKDLKMQKWTQDQAIAFECAREVITDMMAIKTALIATETEKVNPDSEYLIDLRTKRSKLSIERSGLHVDDDAKIDCIREQYGAIVRSWREEMR